jgi:integrase
VSFKEKRAITSDEHQAILERERNPEWRAFYELLWHLGGSQSDIANLRAEDIDWKQRVISYSRKKTGSICHLCFGEDAEAVLQSLPSSGFLFPKLAPKEEKHRAKEFRRRCEGLGIKGVSLHSYRYAWAERARTAGYPERFAQEALGHNSKAVHRAYSRKAQVIVPSLEDFEKRATANSVIVPLPMAASH